MKRQGVRLTIGRIMVVVALVAIALVVLPDPVFVIPLPGATTRSVNLPDGTPVGPRPAISITRFGALLIVVVAGATVVAVVWLARLLLRVGRRQTRPDVSG